ncbi:hypothetical protein [Dactylosporangium darangshiense]|uniref:Uncharacterized protein n=1 Tax=Dactylosporangium darangshiense TaxID=579108 RepID=A0ABP8DFA5_9ACTN
MARNDTSHLAAPVALVDAGTIGIDATAPRPLTDSASRCATTPSPVAAVGKIIFVPSRSS